MGMTYFRNSGENPYARLSIVATAGSFRREERDVSERSVSNGQAMAS